MTHSTEDDDALRDALRAAFPEPADDGFTTTVMRSVAPRESAVVTTAAEDETGWLAAAALLIGVPLILAVATDLDASASGVAFDALRTQAFALLSFEQPLVLAVALTACTLLAPLALEE